MDIEQTKPNDQNKIYYIVLAILGVLIIVLGTIDTFLLINSMTNPSYSSSGNGSSDSTASEKTKKKITDLTKEEAIVALKEMSDQNYAPEGFLNSAMLPEGAKRYYVLEYSYETLNDIKENDSLVSNFGKYSLNVVPANEAYAVVTAVDGDKIIASQPTGVTFNKRYLDFRQGTTTKENWAQSVNDYLEVLDTSDAFIKESLPILYLSLDFFNTSLGSIYDYEFEEGEGITSLITYNIGVGLDTQRLGSASADSLPYAINIYTIKCSINKNNGEFSWDKDEQGNKNKIIKSFPISANEAMELGKRTSL